MGKGINEQIELTKTLNTKRLFKSVVNSTEESVYENYERDIIAEDGSISLKAKILAALLAIPGVLPFSNLNTAFARTPETAEMRLESPRMQKAIRNSETGGRIGIYTKAQVINAVARTIYAEGNGESSKGRKMIGTVLYNRADGNPSKYIDVISKPKQFSCWGSFTGWNPNKFVIRPPVRVMKKRDPVDVQIWDECVKLATNMVNRNFIPDGKWTHYYAKNKVTPSWSLAMNHRKVVGNHTFLYEAADEDDFKV